MPESYDWREETPECVQTPRSITKDCPASYIYSTVSAAEDRICKNSGKLETVRLSA